MTQDEPDWNRRSGRPGPPRLRCKESVAARCRVGPQHRDVVRGSRSYQVLSMPWAEQGAAGDRASPLGLGRPLVSMVVRSWFGPATELDRPATQRRGEVMTAFIVLTLIVVAVLIGCLVAWLLLREPRAHPHAQFHIHFPSGYSPPAGAVESMAFVAFGSTARVLSSSSGKGSVVVELPHVSDWVERAQLLADMLKGFLRGLGVPEGTYLVAFPPGWVEGAEYRRITISGK